ncbi:MAG: Wzz/FepE/Etk N-terminal domain-containing protein [Bacteroidota bacterium]|nr:Wzz/FepE/Etk N-terminal domain-containing protein [Bacteroidota bacterium]MEE2605124.1 Wzz/FepE/Etk N-terminal domain-containing protein [Bacteroidota bacterium]
MEVNSNDEIDIIELLKKLYKSRKVIIYTTIIFSAVGVAFALLSPVKYKSTTVFITQNQETGPSSLSGVASLVGINLGSSSFGGEIPSTMYPQIVESVKFKRLLLNKVIDKKNNFTLQNFIAEYYSIEEVEQDNTIDLGMTLSEEKYFKILTEILNVSVNLKDGFISISCEMPKAEYSARTAKYSRELLQNIIIENKIETARQNLIFSEGQLIEKKREFDEVYSKLAFFSDSNLNSVNSFVLNEKNKLESEFQIISAVVEEISKQVEQAKLQLKKDTPVFSTIQEAVIPIKRSSPKRAQLVIIFGFIGFVISCIIILISKTLKNIFYEVRNN